jgi:23S rRNA pseudouridine1911/1915/1917 synthase
LLGDPVYEHGGRIVENPGLPGDAGYFLHAHKICFKHPVRGDSILVEAPLPELLQLN